MDSPPVSTSTVSGDHADYLVDNDSDVLSQLDMPAIPEPNRSEDTDSILPEFSDTSKSLGGTSDSKGSKKDD